MPEPPTGVPVPIDIAAKLATVITVVIALSPHIRKAFRLLTRSSQTIKERSEELQFMLDAGRVGWLQRRWYFFLDWCRTEDVEKLSWKEWWARRFWCPIAGHDIGNERHRPAGYFLGICTNCHASKVMQTEEALYDWAKRGAVPYWDRELRLRERKRKGKKTR